MFSLVTLLGAFAFCCAQTNNTSSTSSTTVSPPTVAAGQISREQPSTCNCDLTSPPFCTPNCCCDPDCTDKDVNTFTQCLDAVNRSVDRVCVSEYLIMTSNAKYSTKEITSSHLFCIQKDNNPGRNIFVSPDLVTSQQDFTSRISKKNVTSYAAKPATVPSAFGSYYRFGDPILTKHSTGLYGNLGLPTAIGDSSCKDGNVAGYLNDATTSCTRNLQNLALDCSTDSSLRAITYYEGFELFQVPDTNISSDMDGSGMSSNSTTFSPTFVGIELELPVLCLLSESPRIVSDCSISMPIYNNGRCQSVAKEIAYTITHNATEGIVSASVRVVMGTVTSLSFKQRFSIQFIKLATGNKTVALRSGNPGYIKGKPIVAGKLVTGITSGIEMSSNPLNWLTLPGLPLPPGECTQVTDRMPILFREDVRVGCLVRVTKDNVTKNCGYLQSVALSTLRGPSLPTHVAIIGNPDPLNISQWVPIIVSPEPEKTAAEPASGLCPNVPTGIHVEFLYSLTGPLTNPQAEVVGVRYSYITQNIRFKCSAPYCQPSRDGFSQVVEFAASVAFIDVTKPPAQLKKPPFSLSAKLPQDFFYPFFTSSALQFNLNYLVAIFCPVLLLF